MILNSYKINEKICGYTICTTYFLILISTAITNIGSFFNSLFDDNVMGIFAVLIISLSMEKIPNVKVK